ncbi:MAG TPA: MgtC/SapB family protein [Gemmatimonadota bacterium]|nr:MgtC/SapB family protein [Gemmatimonadota bacterium]
MESNLMYQLAIAVALGLLVGLQRERAEKTVAGIRTFAIIGMLGVFAGVLGAAVGDWVIAAGLLSLAALTVMANVLGARAGVRDPGMTTEVAILVMYSIGVALTRGFVLEGIVAAGVLALLLHWKAPLHDFAERIGQDEFAAVMRLVLIGLIVLPVLPNRTFGPYEVLNPFEVWLMVVLIVGISMGGYVAFRLLGPRTGAIAAGLLGGMISSTATTVSYARRSASAPQRSAAAALVIVLASSVVFVRVLVEIAVVAPGVLAVTAGPLGAMLVLTALIAGALYVFGIGSHELEVEDQQPPSELKAAVVFGLLYAVVLMAVAFAEDRLGQRGLYGVAALSGLTDLDAITLSTANLMQAGQLELATGWRMILIGGLSNVVFKGGVVLLLGSRALRGRITLAFGAALLGGVAILALWPG